MSEQISKLTPDRDLQCYFLTPSAVAAMSSASASGFTVSGKWRQQFDWAVVEWNRDNVFEHPSLRPLPDGDLSGLALSYDEERTGCIPIESNLYPIVDWPDLRLWTEDETGIETITHVNLWPDYARPVEGTYTPASGAMTLVNSPGVGNRIGLAFLESHYYYTVQPGDSLGQVAQGIATAIDSDPDFSAASNGPTVTVTWKAGPNWASLVGANGNRITMYGFAQSGASCWEQPAVTFAGGQFPTKYNITINFGSLVDSHGVPIATQRVRKMRWTWAADLQPTEFQQTEFQVQISNWTVTGINGQYSVAGPGSRRIEDTDPEMSYEGDWTVQTGNYSGSRIHDATEKNANCSLTYSETAPHDLYLGTRLLTSGADISITLDGQRVTPFLGTFLNGEDVLVRNKIASLPAGSHTVTFAHAGPAGADFYLDFVEIAYPSVDLPEFMAQPELALATDWDTYHSQSLAAERTAWLIQKLGYNGRVNHYAGALWFYEIYRPGTQYATLTLAFTIDTAPGSPTAILDIGPAPTSISHLILPDDTVETTVQAFAALINVGSNLVWASASGNQLTLTARAMGVAGNGISVGLDAASAGVSVTGSGALSGGVDGAAYDLDPSSALNQTLKAAADYWRTDLTATPRLNRAARDWHAAYFTALKGYGLDCVCSFSTELMNGDPSAGTGIAQCYPDGSPVVLNTPAIQTNFSPTALAFWTQAYLDIAGLQSTAGLTPYLQAGEVQWWYFPDSAGMPFYDAWAQAQFQSTYGKPMQTIASNTADPTSYPNECVFLPGLIGNYTAAIRSALQSSFPGCRFEVLYPTDVNDTPLNQVTNYPADWTPQNLTCLKTESFSFTADYNLDLSTYSIGVSAAKGFTSGARSHVVGISDSWSSWMKEVDIAQAAGLESVVLFALDQYCLIGYPPPPFVTQRRTQRQA